MSAHFLGGGSYHLYWPYNLSLVMFCALRQNFMHSHTHNVAEADLK